MSGLRVPVVGPSCHVRHAPHPHNAASFSQRTCIRRFRQNADPFSQNSPISPFFTQWVCTLAAKPRQVAAAPSPIGGNCTTRGCDTPATRRKRASCSAKPPPSPVWRVLEGPEGLAAVLMSGGRSTTGGAGGAEVRQYSPPRTAPGRCRYKIRPADPFSPRARDKIRPVDPFSPRARYNTRPARSKWPFLARFVRAG